MIETKTYRKILSRIGLCFFMLMGLTQVLQGVGAALAAALCPQVMNSDWYIWVLSYVPLYCIAVPLFFLLMHWLLPASGPAPERNDLKPVQFLLYLVLSFGGMYLFNIVTNVLMTLVSLATGLESVNPLLQVQQSSGLIWNILFGCIIAPVGEELIFRKALYAKAGILGDKCYVLLGGLVFSLFHGNLSQMIYAFALGVLFCYIYARTGRIIYTIALHVLVNAIGMVVAPMALGNQIALGILGMCVMAAIAGAIAIFCLNYRSIHLSPPVEALPEHPVRNALLNPGMLLYILLCMCLVVIVILSPLLMEALA